MGWAAAIALGVAGCTGSAAPAPRSEPTPASAASDQAADVERFGDPVPEGATVPLAQVLAEPQAHGDDPLLLEGHVRRVCQRKGCWMELATGPDEGAPACRVTFQDYGFFVPTDADGAHARLQGRIAVDTIPAEHVAHLEEEGGRFEHKREDGSAREVRVVATGVELHR